MKKLLGFWMIVVLAFAFGKTAAQQTDTISFLHITDLHEIFNPDDYQPDFIRSRTHFSKGVPLLKQFLQNAPTKTHSNFIVATGDLIDFFEAQSQENQLKGGQIEKFSQLTNKCKIPVFFTLGNHDIATYKWKDSLKISSQNDSERARANWIRKLPCFNDGTYYSRVYQVNGTEYRLIFLENGYNTIFPGESSPLPYFDRTQLHWLADQLDRSATDIEVIFMHLPLVSSGFSLAGNESIYAVLAKYPSVKAIFAGHNHKNLIENIASGKNSGMVQVQTGAFGSSVDNWRLVRLTKDKIVVSFPGKSETERIIPVK